MNAIELTEDLQTRTGLGEKEARGIVRAILQAVEDTTAQLVTRDHLDAEMAKLRGELRAEIQALRGDSRADNQALRAEMYQGFRTQTTWLAATVFAAAGFVIAAVKLI